MSAARALQMSPNQAGAALSPQQKRFNSLIRQIEQARQTLAAWPAAVAAYRQSHAQLLQPLLESRDAAQRAWAFALEDLLEQRGWTKTERETLAELLCEAAGGLLDMGVEDAELKALFDRYAEVDFDTEQQESMRAMKDMAELMTGLDLGQDDDIRSQEDLFERVRQGFQQQAAAQQAAEDVEPVRPARRQSAAQRKREAEAQQATQSVREIYRKLASALHPDRETDPAQREAKTALMQKVNQAHEAGDLLTLLELQLQIEQIDADHAARADPQRLKHYNKVLAEQLEELKDELLHAEAAFGMEFGLMPGAVSHPRQLGPLLERQLRELRADLAQAALDARMLEDKAVTKRWLKAERRRLRSGPMGFDFF
ncbi:J domain-containing protein [uncultured Azohydromonas sp.]|mgnify:CR=1 FL=1|uniref:J domain-containing protein n=1 Tax=uncultured Azohydromonas sp. TaxID=487342 RepID=UPI002629B441|nr:J domain-containing protein [uncultured Azohydromonas sp.]